MYQTEVNGRHHELGTSGFLYRSNKLMYDAATKSYWSTLKGEPVVGPLVNENIKLNRREVVTTTWGEWKRRHPETTVLSLNTGHNRDYGEGVAYGNYFNNQQLMFSIPQKDRRLRNKDEVLALRNGDSQLAIAADFLASHPVHQDQIGSQAFVVLTDHSGANRVYATDGQKFLNWDGDKTATDNADNTWTATENSLTDSAGHQLKRLPAHRAFWFGWYSQFPDTRLVK